MYLQAQNPIADIENLTKTPTPANLNSHLIAPHPSVTQANYQNAFTGLSQSEQHKQIMLEVEQHSSSKYSYAQTLINEAIDASKNGNIVYSIEGKNVPGRELFHSALNELNLMLENKSPLSIKRAVFLSEYAYDPSLNWVDFEKSISDMATHVGYYMQENGYDKNDNSAKNLAIFNFFNDTITANHPSEEHPISSYPLLYDFEDFWGKQDASKMFVSKLIRDGTGQCHSLPLLYLIIAEEIGAEAHLAFAPNHSYIKIQDKFGDWYNIELTTHSLTSDQFIMQTGFVKSAAILNRIYLNPLSKQEVVAQCVNDLVLNYVRKFGYEEFILNGTSVAHYFGSNSISTHLINHNYYQALLQSIIHQYQQNGLSERQFSEDEEAMYVYHQMMGSRELIDNLGYADMPPDMYEKWLNSVRDEGRKQEHMNKMRTLIGNTSSN